MPNTETFRSPMILDPLMLQRREECVRKFLSGEWGVELSGFEEGRAKDREADAQMLSLQGAWADSVQPDEPEETDKTLSQIAKTVAKEGLE